MRFLFHRSTSVGFLGILHIPVNTFATIKFPFVETHGCASKSRERLTFFSVDFQRLIDLSSLGDAQPCVSTNARINLNLKKVLTTFQRI